MVNGGAGKSKSPLFLLEYFTQAIRRSDGLTQSLSEAALDHCLGGIGSITGVSADGLAGVISEVGKLGAGNSGQDSSKGHAKGAEMEIVGRTEDH